MSDLLLSPMARRTNPPSTSAAVITGAVELIGDVPTEGKRITERGLGAIELLAANGRTHTSIAKAIGVDRHTLTRIITRQPEVADAIDRGRSALSDELHDLLMSAARKNNITAQIYLSKARCGWREGEAIPGLVQNTQININMPAPLTDAQFKALLAPQKAEAVDA